MSTLGYKCAPHLCENKTAAFYSSVHTPSVYLRCLTLGSSVYSLCGGNPPSCPQTSATSLQEIQK